MLVIAIAAIVLAFAAPNFNETIKNNRLTNKVNDIVVALGIARQTAIARGVTTMVCHSNDTETNGPSCAGGTASNWSTGNIIYTVPINTIVTAQRDYNASTDTIIQQSKLNDNDNIVVTDIGGNAGNYISFASSGLLFGSTAPITLQVCDDRTGEDGTIIRVSSAGRVTTQDATAGGNACA